MRLTKWVRVNQIIENYKKDYPKRWKSFLDEMDKVRKIPMDNTSKFRLSAKFPAYPNETDISFEIMKVIPDFVTNDRKWNKFKKLYPEFFR